MWHVKPFEVRVNELAQKYLNVDLNECDTYTIWKFCPGTSLNAVNDLVINCGYCKPEWFPFIYWSVLFLSLASIIFYMVKILHLCGAKNKPIYMWRKRHFYVLSNDFVRRCRFIGTILMLTVGLLLLIGTVTALPTLMTPWLLISALNLSIEFVVWMFDIVSGRYRLKVDAVFTFLQPLALLILVNCISKIFQKSTDRYNLRLYEW